MDNNVNEVVVLPAAAAAEVGTLRRADELNQHGANFFGRGLMEPARLHFLAALHVDPNHVQALQNLGAVLRNMGHFAAAESVARRSVALAPDNPFCRSNLGVSQLSNKRFIEAWVTLKDVLRMLPESPPSWHNYGLLLYMMGRHSEALSAFRKSVELTGDGPVNPHLISDQALTLLQLQRIQEGLALYEARWSLLAKSPIWHLGLTEWKGEPVAGKHVLLHHEQGFGDGIMLIRFLPKLLSLQCKVTVAAPKELVRLFTLAYGDVVNVVPMLDEENNIPATLREEKFDYHVPMLSMLRYIGIEKTTQIDPTPYLVAPRGANLPHFMSGQYKVGIVWASGDHGPVLNERRRLAPLVEFLGLTEIKNTVVVSLQKGKEGDDLRRFGLEGIIYDLAPKLKDFADTAAAILKMDVVISVDSAVAHLAGALGVPCLMLSPYTKCWRWWGHKTGMPWYRGMQIFYQKQNGSWTEAVYEAIRVVRLLHLGIK
jgi:Flp pilus assembly protein TadD